MKFKTAILFALVLAMLANAAHATPVKAQTPIGDRANLSNETIPDGTVMNPGQQFKKCWTVKNTGDTIWNTSYTLVFVSGDQLSAPNTSYTLSSNVDRKNTVEICIDFVAPATAGTYRSTWQMKNALGVLFDYQIYVEIVVQNIGSNVTYGQTLNANSTPSPRNFEFREVSTNKIEIYYEGEWKEATPSPNNIYVINGQTGEYKLLYYMSCYTDYLTIEYWTGWVPHFKQVCEKKSRDISESGLGAAVTYSQEGVIEFYSYIRGLTFGLVGNVAGGTLTGINGYQIYEIGSTSSAKLATLTKLTSRAAPPILIVSYIVMAERMFIVTYPITAVPVATPDSLKFDIASYASITGLYNAVIGYSKGDYSGSNWWARWQIISLNGVCSMMIYLRLPKSGNEGFQLDNFSQKFDQECDPGKILAFMFEIAKQAMKAGVSVDTCLWFLREFLPKIAADFKIDPALVDAILKLLASL